MDKSVKEYTYELFKINNITDAVLKNRINQVIEKKKKEMVYRPKNPYTKEKRSYPVIDFVYHKQSNLPYKLIILQKMKTPSGDELRFCYYIVNFTLLKREGKLQMKYGQFGLNIPIEDYNILIDKAKRKGMI